MGKTPAQKPPTAAGPMLGTLQQIASQTGVPAASLRKLLKAGHLQRVQLGESRRTWIKWADVQRLIERSTLTQGGE